MGNRTKREEISKLETACASLEKQLREKEFEVLCMYTMLGGQGQEISSACVDCITQKAHTASETEKGLRVQIENLQLEVLNLHCCWKALTPICHPKSTSFG